MSFREIDEAHRSAPSLSGGGKGRGRKRKGAGGLESLDDKTAYVSERRTGRWTTEEMTYCDKLIDKFAGGDIPVSEGVKLNEFLGNMLKSKQSRLTKKMKNAKLSSKTFHIQKGHLDSIAAREFSDLEESFFQAVIDPRERAEIKFHMQKEWREQFCRVCTAIGQPLDADAWLNSVEEMDRRSSTAKDAARMAKRKKMMGIALRTDLRNPDQGVFIEKPDETTRGGEGLDGDDEKDVEDEMLTMLAQDGGALAPTVEMNGKSSLLHSAPFLAKVTAYMHRHNVPFEHCDVWVPSFVPNEVGATGDQTNCRLCYAGSATVEKLVIEDCKTVRDLTPEQQFNLLAFGDYSQKFSFEVGCGLPGRVYETGRPTWEQSVHKAPNTQFERGGGATQWGIRTVLGIPIASPNVGRIVVAAYSMFDREKDEDLVSRLSEEFTRLLPCPKWKLVVDIGEGEDSAPAPAAATASAATVNQEDDTKGPAEPSAPAQAATTAAPVEAAVGRDTRIDEVIGILGEFMPSDPNSPLAAYVPGFMSLRLLLLRSSRSNKEEELVKPVLDSFSAYSSGGRQRSDIALMLARDFMFLVQQQQVQQVAPPPAPPQRHHLQQQSTAAAAQFLAPQASNVAAQGTVNPALSVFGQPLTSTNFQIQNSPALIPIPARGNADSMSVVSA